MSFFRVNGWAVRVSERGVSQKTIKWGTSNPGFNNRPRRDHRSLPREISQQTCQLTQEEADTLEGLFEGNVHQFTGLTTKWSDRGLYVDGGTWIPFTVNPFGVMGTIYVSGVGSYNAWIYAYLPDDQWTLAWWRYLGLGIWQHRVLRSDGLSLIDGVPSFVPDMVVTNGTIYIINGEYAYIDVMPFFACEDYIAQSYAWSVLNVQPTGMLNPIVDGDIFGGVMVPVVGKVGNQNAVQVGDDNGWENNRRTVSLTIYEAKGAKK